MTLFIIDQMLLALSGVVMIVCVPIVCGPIFSVVLQIVIALIWLLLCRQLVFLPLDLILGKKKETLFFSGIVSVDYCEFFRKKFYHRCMFSNRMNKTIVLTIPIVLTKEELDKQSLPLQGQEVEIVFYPLSKILCSWKIHPNIRSS